MNSKVKSLNYTMFAPDQKIAEDNASLAFGYRMGEVLPLETSGFPAALEVANKVVPGVYLQHTALTIGTSEKEAGFDDPINKVWRALYTKYWSKNSSISAFRPMDIGIYTLASAQLVALIGWMKAVYRTAHLSSSQNKYINSALLKAYGVDPAMITAHINDLKAYIDMKCVELRQVVLDKDLPVYLYAYDMYQHILKDSANSSKTQYYVTAPRYVMRYVRTGENIGSITYTDLFADSNYYDSWDRFTSAIDEVFKSYFQSAYLSSISAAIEKAIGGKGFTIEYMQFNEVEEPFYDEMALLRIKNSIVPGHQFKPGDIVQHVVDDYMSQDTTVKWEDPQAAESYIENKLLTTNYVLHAASPKDAAPTDVVVLASLMPAFTESNDGFDFQYTMTSHCPEVVTDAAVLTYINETELGIAPITSQVGIQQNGDMVNRSDVLAIMRAMKLAKEFDYFPSVYIGIGHAYTDVSSNPADLAYVFDYDYSRVVTANDLRRIHQGSIYALFGIPSV